jgi:uncharacterized protein (TIGR03067 family)
MALDPRRRPAPLDLHPADGQEGAQGIIEVNGDTLTYAFRTAGDGRGRPTSLDPEANRGCCGASLVLTMKRAK